MAIADGQGAGEDAFGIDVWVVLLNFIRPEDVHLKADQLGHPFYMLKPFELHIVEREADTTAAVPGDILPGQLLKLGVERVAVVMDLGHVVIGDENGALSGRVPGGTRGQFSFFNEQAIGPALFRQMIKKSGAHHSAANDDDARVTLHCLSLRP